MADSTDPLTPAQALRWALEQCEQSAPGERLTSIDFGNLAVEPYGVWVRLDFTRTVASADQRRTLTTHDVEQAILAQLERDKRRVTDTWERRFVVTDQIKQDGDPVSFQPGGLTPGGSCRG